MKRMHERPLATLLTIALLTLSAPATASTGKDPSLQDLVQDSDLIVVGAITAVDDTAGATAEEPLTRVDIAVERTLRGNSAPSGKTFSIYYRGGLRADGLTSKWTNTPELVVGDRYVMFMRAEYPIHPFVDASANLMRVVRSGDRDVVVDRYGQLIGASASLGLMRGARIAETAQERAADARDGVAQRAEPVAAVAMTPQTDIETVFAFIRGMSDRTMPSARQLRDGQMPARIDYTASLKGTAK